MALREASAKAAGANVYVTLEPCAHRSTRGPACADLLVEAGVRRVIAGQKDPDKRTAGAGLARLAAGGIDTQWVDSAASRASLTGYLMRAKHGRPHVTLKLAMSLDGHIALESGESRWITGPVARAHVHARRAMSDAILVGGQTWRSDAPRLDVRLPGLGNRSPKRIVLTRRAVPEEVQAIASPEDIAGLEDAAYLYVEGGAQTAAAFLAADLVDRLDLYRAPIILGRGLNAIGDIDLADLRKAHGRWRLAERRRLGSDTFEAYSRLREKS